jgi:hypothetical protein
MFEDATIRDRSNRIERESQAAIEEYRIVLTDHLKGLVTAEEAITEVNKALTRLHTTAKEALALVQMDEDERRGVRTLVTRQSTDWVIKDALNCRINRDVYRAQYGTARLRFYRTGKEEWFADIIDTSRIIRNSDEKHYSRPSYLKGFVLNNLSVMDADTVKWSKETTAY